MAQVIPLRPHTFRLDNCLIDDYAAEVGAMGVAVYAVLQRYADRTTGQCWPSVATIARLLRLSKNCVKKYLHLLARLGLITIAPRATAEGDPTSNRYTVHDPTQRDAVQRRRRERQRGELLIRLLRYFQHFAHDVAPLRVRRRAYCGRSLDAGAGPHRPPDS